MDGGAGERLAKDYTARPDWDSGRARSDEGLCDNGFRTTDGTDRVFTLAKPRDPEPKNQRRLALNSKVP